MHGLHLPDPGEPRYCARCAGALEQRPDGGRGRPHCPQCGWTYYGKPALGAATLIEEDDRVLLVQRAHDPYIGWWTLPAGYVEYGEDAAETAVRETLEETGLVVDLGGIHGVFFGAGDPRGASHLVVFYARRLGGMLAAGDDAADARWFHGDDIPDEIAFEGTRKALSVWAAGKNRGRASSPLLFAGSGPAPPLLVYAVVENPKGTVDRMVYDAAQARFVPGGEVFHSPLPIHYGWIPRTVSHGDQRELDVVVAGEGDTRVGSVVPVRPIGALLREDQDHKVLGVRVDLPSAYAGVTDVADSPDLKETVDALFRPRARIAGWASAPEARQLIMDAHRAWIELHRGEA